MSTCRNLLFSAVIGFLLVSGKDVIRFSGGAADLFLQWDNPESALSQSLNKPSQRSNNTSSATLEERSTDRDQQHGVKPGLPGTNSSFSVARLDQQDTRAQQQPNSTSFAQIQPTKLPDCMVANVESTRRFLSQLQSARPPLPIINLGFPKIGTNTMHAFLRCAGLKSSHTQDGLCMKRAHAKRRPLLASCPKRMKPQAWMQLDSNFPSRGACYYPQLSNLPQFHKEAPNATFVLAFRPFKDWYKSLSKWFGMRSRLRQCNLPGLPKGQGNSSALRAWFCGHVTNVRNFVQRHPSHALIELDLYDDEANSEIMSQLFQAKPSCWGHKNIRASKPKA